MPKPLLTSRTILAKVILIGVAAFYRPLYDWIKETPEVYFVLDFLVTVSTRWITKGPVTMRKHDTFILIFFLLLLMSLTGCTTWQQPLDTRVYYRYDMRLYVNGQSFDGVAVVPRADKYLIRVESLGDVDMLTIKSCNRETPVSDAIKQGWIKFRRSYEFEYIPNRLEKEGGCPLELGGYDKANGRHSWAYIDFEDPEADLPSGITCNGLEEYRSDGVAICQSHTGLEQMIRFVVPVEIDTEGLTPRCLLPVPEDKKTWRYLMPQGICTLAFVEIGGEERIHRLTTLGYDQIVIRGQ